MAHVSGKEGKIGADSSDFHVRDWEGDLTADAIDVTDTGDAGYRTFIAGLLSGTVSFSAFWDDASQPETDPPDLRPGKSISMELRIGTSAKSISGTCLVTSARYRSTVDGAVEFNGAGNFTGAFQEPT